MIISMHTPKAGGTSFKELLKNHFKSGFLGDYNDLPINKTREKRHAHAEKFNKHFKLYKRFYYNFTNIECIHGHFLPYKYITLVEKNNHKFITWFRDPLERLASHYYYWQRAFNENRSGPLHRKVVLEEWSFQKFAFSPEMKNFYQQFLWNFPVENFDFIGVTEHFEQDCRFFAKEFLGENKIIVPQNNKNPKALKTYYDDKVMHNELMDFHSLDYKLYNYALNKRKQRFND